MAINISIKFKPKKQATTRNKIFAHKNFKCPALPRNNKYETAEKYS